MNILQNFKLLSKRRKKSSLDSISALLSSSIEICWDFETNFPWRDCLRSNISFCSFPITLKVKSTLRIIWWQDEQHSLVKSILSRTAVDGSRRGNWNSRHKDSAHCSSHMLIVLSWVLLVVVDFCAFLTDDDFDLEESSPAAFLLKLFPQKKQEDDAEECLFIVESKMEQLFKNLSITILSYILNWKMNKILNINSHSDTEYYRVRVE